MSGLAWEARPALYRQQQVSQQARHGLPAHIRRAGAVAIEALLTVLIS